MIVKYVRDRGYRGSEKDLLYTINREYVVLDISHNGYQFLVTVKSDTKDPGFIGLQYCDVIDPIIPPNWIICGSGKNLYRFSPKEFAEFEDDFWELCDDGDKAALEILEKVYRDLQIFHGIEPDPVPVEPVKEEHPFAWSDKWLHED